MTFAADFADMMPDVLVATPGTTDEYGAFLASGEVLSIPCRIEGRNFLIRGLDGKQVVSNVQAILDGDYGLSTHAHRYTLPSRFGTYQNLQAVSIAKEADEEGPCYEIVMFP